MFDKLHKKAKQRSVGIGAQEYISAGDFARDQKNWEVASDNYSSALELDPEKQDIWVQLGNMEKECHRYTSAKQAYDKALSMKPMDSDVHLQLGHLYKLMRDIPASLASYRRSLECDPTNQNAYEELEALGFARDANEILNEIQSVKSKQQQLIFDVTDMVTYLGHHSHVTGIQRVQSCIILSLVRNQLVNYDDMQFISFDRRVKSFRAINKDDFIDLLDDLTFPDNNRTVKYDKNLAKDGIIFPLAPLAMVIEHGNAVVVLLGAAWVIPDYANLIANLKRRFGARFVMLFHDLIPVYAKETCDQGTARVFKIFLDQIIGVVDLALSVSQSTANDLRRYCHENRINAPRIEVTRLGGGFDEFLQGAQRTTVCADADEISAPYIPEEPYVLFVSTIEGRKNHEYVLRIWRHMIENGIPVPKLLCVGRLGWRSVGFLNLLMGDRVLGSNIEILEEISDSQLDKLYRSCEFTIFPSLYEGWGLPVSESLSHGKVCVTSNRTSLPEVAGEFGVYVPLDDVVAASDVIAELCCNKDLLAAREAEIRSRYEADSWKVVAGRVLNACEASRENSSRENYPQIELGKEYLLKSQHEDSPDYTGEALFGAVISAHYGPIMNTTVSPRQKVIGLASRDDRWREPETWGCWSRGPQCGFDFLLDRGHVDQAEDGLLFYFTFHLPATFLPAFITMSVGGVMVETPRRVESDTHTCAWQMPKSILTNHGYLDEDGHCVVSLELEIAPYASSNLDHISTQREQVPHLGVISFACIAADDLASRLAIAESGYFRSAEAGWRRILR